MLIAKGPHFATQLEGAIREIQMLLELKGSFNCLQILKWSFRFNTTNESLILIETAKRYDSSLYNILPIPDDAASLQKIIHAQFPNLDYDLIGIINIAKQIIVGLIHIHSKNIIHMDLKPANIFINHTPRVTMSDHPVSVSELVIGDFGFSHKVDFTPTESWGTVAYKAPEIIQCGNNNIHYTTYIDIYAFGIILNQLLSGKQPVVLYNTYEDVRSAFQQNKSDAIDELVCKGIRPTLFTTFLTKSVKIVNRKTIHQIEILVKKCWGYDSSSNTDGSYGRPTALEISTTLDLILQELN